MSQKPAVLDWRDATPVSTRYDDVYFSVDNGLAETQFVFLQNNHLPKRWANLTGHFTVLETGFGTGLNFLATAQLWQQCSPVGTTLHFISIEKYPLNAAAIRKALSVWPELTELCEQLCQQLPPAIDGWHCLDFPSLNIRLSLVYDDVSAALDSVQQSDARADAIFLDGFAPAKNPDMWTDEIMAKLCVCANEHATLATFTAVGRVRRALQAGGFNMEKVSGFGRKREMLRGQFEAQVRYPQPCWNLQAPSTPPQTAAVIGAGIAGCNIAHQLAIAGIKVTVLEQAKHIAAGASGNPQGIVFLKLSASDGDLAAFSLSAYLHASRFYGQCFNNTPPSDEARNECGMLYLLQEEEWQALKTKYADHADWIHFLTPEQASQTANTRVNDFAIYLPHGQWLKPSALCQQLLDHPNITLQTEQSAVALHSHTDDRWTVRCTDREFSADSVVIANAFQSQSLLSHYKLPIRPAAGQITQFETNTQSIDLHTIVCGKAYAAPSSKSMTIGASFRMNSKDCTTTEEDHQQNFADLQNALPEFTVPSCYSGRTSVRTASTDYLPLVGPVADITAFYQQFRALRSDAKLTISEYGSSVKNLYLFTGLGSRGLSYAPLCAHILSNTIVGKGVQSYPRWQALIHPSRFLIRALKRNKTEHYYV